MGNKLQNAALAAAASASDVQWYIAMAARYGEKMYAERAILKLQTAAAELQAALDEVKE